MKAPEAARFLQRQRSFLLAGLGVGLAVAALLAWLLARHIGRPVTEAAEGIRALAGGDYDRRLEVRGEDEIARLGRDVNRLAESLADHREARQRWMADIAHELRTPLSIINGELEAMTDGVRPMNPETLASVQQEVGHLRALVDDLRDLALSDSGSLAYHMEQLDLAELAASVAEPLQAQAQAQGLELVVEQPDETLLVEADERRLRQLIGNLLQNSMRYTDAPGTIEVRLERNDGQVELSVSDSAPGVLSRDLDRLFERFYRVEGSRSRNTGGTGLGLAICRNIAEAHGGSILAKAGSLGGLHIVTSLPMAK